MISRFHVYYTTPDNFSLAMREDKEFSINNLGKTHRFITTVDIECDTVEGQVNAHESAFSQMQAEYWSPNGEARELIHMAGVEHTSMSVGDILFSESTGKFLQVKSFDWINLKE